MLFGDLVGAAALDYLSPRTLELVQALLQKRIHGRPDTGLLGSRIFRVLTHLALPFRLSRALVGECAAHMIRFAYSPLKSGSLFCKKAVNPSTMSLVFLQSSRT